MTPEAQRAAIAEACGWRFVGQDVSLKEEAIMCWVAPGDEPHQQKKIPDYLNDLNAMHEVEKTLTGEQEAIYRQMLCAVMDEPEWSPWRVVSAPADMRAKAFLRTLGLWKP